MSFGQRFSKKPWSEFPAPMSADTAEYLQILTKLSVAESRECWEKATALYGPGWTYAQALYIFRDALAAKLAGQGGGEDGVLP